MLCVELVCFDFGMFCWFVWMSCVWITLVSTDFGLFGVDVMWFELMCVDSKLFMCYLRLVYVFELHLRWFVLDCFVLPKFISIVFVLAWGNVCGFVWIRFVRMLFVLNCLILFDWICVDWIGPGSTCVELFWIAWFVLSWLLNCLVELLGFVIFVFTLFDNFDLFGLYSFGFNLCWLALN